MADAADIAGLLNRWRADSIGSANAAAVTSWAALAGSFALAQGTTANQPTYRTNVLNGQPVVRFDGGSDWVQGTISTRSQPITYVVVASLRITSKYHTLIHNGVEIQSQNSSGTTWEMWGGSANVRGGTPTTSPVVLTVTANGASCTIHVNGTQVASGNGGTSGATATLVAGRHPTAGRYFDGDMAEILLYDHALTSDERATVHSYVQDRYGITVADYVADTPPQGSGSGSFTFTGSAQGKREPKGSGLGSVSFTGTGTGNRTPKGSGGGFYAFTGSGTGKRTPKASGTGTAAYSGSAAGKRTPKASGAGTYAYTGTAVGVAPSVESATASGSGTFAWAGSATGVRHPKADATGAYTFAGSGQGKRVPVATGAGQFGFSGAAVGATARQGTGSGVFGWTGTGTGGQLRHITLTVTATGRRISAASGGRRLSFQASSRRLTVTGGS